MWLLAFFLTNSPISPGTQFLVSLAGCCFWVSAGLLLLVALAGERRPASKKGSTITPSKSATPSAKATSNPSIPGKNCEPLGPLPDEALDALFGGPLFGHRVGLRASQTTLRNQRSH